MRKSNIFLKGLLILSSLFVIAGCDETETLVTVELPASLATDFPIIDKIVLKVSAPDMATLTESLVPPFDPSPTFSLNVPIGNDRLFEMTASTTLGPRFGFYGQAMRDITDAPTVVPIEMDFMNFADDAIDDTQFPGDRSFPDMTRAKIFFEKCPLTPDALIVEIEMLWDLGPDSLTIVEFDADGNPFTGAAPSKIEKEKGGVTNNFSMGTNFYYEIMSKGGVFSGLVRDSSSDITLFPLLEVNASSLPVPGPDPVSLLQICMARADFTTLDPNLEGIFNILVKGKDASGGLQANDIAYEGGEIVYDLSFDTTVP